MRKALRLRTLLSVATLAFLGGVGAQNVGINVTGAAPNASALLDLDVSGITGQKRGLLIPRVLRANRLAIPAPVAAGMWVYQTDDVTAPVFDPAEEHGFWYHNGTQWIRWAPGIGSWTLTGNAGTNPAALPPNYIGSNAGATQHLHLRTNSVGNPTPDPQMVIMATTGHVGINTTVAPPPTERLDVNGAARIFTPPGPGSGSASNLAGTIRYNDGATAPNRWHFGNHDGTATGWQRLENAEDLVTSAAGYTRDSLGCAVSGTMTTSPIGTTAPGTDNGQCSTPPCIQAGNVNTPFPTNTGSPNQRLARTQYIFPVAELSAMVLCPGNITELAFYALQADVNIPGPPVQQASINYQVRIAHTALASFTGQSWDNGVQAAAVSSTGTTVVLGGWIPFTFSSPFNWNGVQNIVVDIYWLRAATNGNSPAVQLVTGLPYQATRQGLPNGAFGVGLPNVAAVAPPFDDNGPCIGLCATSVPSPPQLNMTNATSRPVTRFTGQVKTVFPANVPNAPLVRYSGGVMLGDAVWAAAAGNYKGPGTIHAKNGVYDGNSLLNDHVFDSYFDGTVRPEDAEAAKRYTHVELADLKGYLAEERHLPNLPSRSEWNGGGAPSLGELQNGLWQQVETQALYITELERDLTALEVLAFGDDLDAAKLAEMEADIARSPRLTEQQKLHLIAALRNKADNR